MRCCCPLYCVASWGAPLNKSVLHSGFFAGISFSSSSWVAYIVSSREKLAGFLKERIPECRPTLTKKEVEAAEDLDLTGEPLDMGFDPNQEWNLSVSGEDGGLSGGSRGPRLKGLKLGEARVWLSKREEKERWALVEGGENLYLGNRVDSNQTMLSKVGCILFWLRLNMKMLVGAILLYLR